MQEELEGFSCVIELNLLQNPTYTNIQNSSRLPIHHYQHTLSEKPQESPETPNKYSDKPARPSCSS